MKIKKMLNVNENAMCAGYYLKDYVCLLDDPAMRRIALTMVYEDAKRIFENNMACHTDYETAQKLVAMELVSFVEGVAGHLGVEPEQVANNRLIGYALHDIAMHVSNNENRIIACRQISAYPSLIAECAQEDGTLNDNTLHVASEVKKAMLNIGLGMEQLKARKEVTK